MPCCVHDVFLELEEVLAELWIQIERLVIGIVIEVDIGEYVLATGDGVWFGI